MIKKLIDLFERHPFYLLGSIVIFSLGAPLGWFAIDMLFLPEKLPVRIYKLIVVLYIAGGTIFVFLCFGMLLIFLIYRLKEYDAKLDEIKNNFEKSSLELKSRMMRLSSAAGEFAKAKDKDEVFYRLAEAAFNVVGFDRIGVMEKVEAEGGCYLQIVEVRGLSSSEFEYIHEVYPCDERVGALSVAAVNGISIIYNEGDLLPYKFRLKPPYDKIPLFRSKSFVVVPVKVDDRVEILIAGDRKNTKGKVTSEDKVLLEVLADSASHALSSLKYKKQLEELARTDPLTGLFNRRFWFELAEKEFKKAQRYNVVFSIMIMDLDNFKRINDTYGHQVGDNILAVTGNIVRESLRDVDIAGRYGGEEFVVLLPHTDSAEAFLVAERVRKRVEEANYAVEERVTITIGVSQYLSGRDLDEVIALADKALYVGKREGKNKVVVME